MNQKEIKIIALDLNGTLLNNNSEISDENLAVIQKVQEQCPDIKIIIATGLDPHRAMKYIKQAKIKQAGNYLICYSGGAIMKNLDEGINVIAKKALSFQQFKEILKAAENYHAEELQFNDLYHRRIYGLDDIKTSYSAKASTINDLNQDFFYNALLIFSRSDTEIDIVIKELREKYPEFQIAQAKLTNSNPFLNIDAKGIGVEISAPNTDKGQALIELCEKLQIDREQVLACGDEMNDKTMLEFAEYSVAMNNNPEIKKIAKFAKQL